MTTSEKKLTRRSFLATTALTAGAMATASMAGCSSVSTDEKPELSETGEQAAAADEQIFTNICRGNCGGPCVLQGKVREGKLVSTTPMVFPDEAEGLQQGCIKGHTNPVRLYATNRILHPMRQTGARGSDQWEEISWDEAIEEVAQKFQAAFDEYGHSSVAFWTGAGNANGYINACFTYFDNNNRVPNVGIAFERFFSAFGVTSLSSSHDIAQLYLQASILQAPFASVECLPHSKVILLWGANPTDAQRAHWYWICKARENGAKVITIDPQYTNAAAHSDIWVPVRQGTDGALALAMCNWIIDNGYVDESYLKSGSVAPLLIKEDGMYLRLSDLGQAESGAEEDVPVVWDNASNGFVPMTSAADPALNGTHEVNGVSVRTVYDATLEAIRPFTVDFAAEECGLPASLIEEVAEIYATSKPGYIMNNWGLEHLYNSWRLYYDLPFLASLTGNFGVIGSGYSSGFSGAASSCMKTPLTTDWSQLTVEDPASNRVITGEYITEIMETGKWAGKDFPIRCVCVAYGNPLHSCMGTSYIRKALDKVDYIVTMDSFMTDSAQYSDLVLPVAMSWEMEDFNGSFFMQKAVEPAGECRTNMEIFRAIAEKLGRPDVYTKSEGEYLREILDTPENIEAGVAYDNYREQGVIMGEYAYAESDMPEYNALGRTQFYLESVPPRDNYGQEIAFVDHLPYYEHAFEAYPTNPLREKYPLFGLSYHDNYHAQSLFSHNAWLDEFRTFDGEPYMRIHESAAAERGITTGDTVRVFNDHGSCVLKAVVTKGIREDTILMPHGFQGDEFIEGHAQDLTCMCPDPITSNNNLNDWLCQVEKA